MKRTCIRPVLLTALFALTASAAWAGNAKVQVCHIPPGNPASFHTITISENALQAHLGHGDLAGACFAHCDTLCSDGNACTIDACDASERCISTRPPVNCDDGSLCTIDSCNPATGCSSVPKICMDSDNCTVNSCDPLTGSCVAPPVACPVGQNCNPADGECQGTDFCASNPCENGVCMNGPNSYSCLCVAGWTGTNCEIEIDACDGVVCPVPDQCHEPATCSGGVCSPHPNKPDGTPCDAGIFGVLNERCQNGLCVYEYPY
ncbi:MAG TPA: calcium-binding EGF-like domain-containing protein [Thermoanaerobaculia bacterium]|nr:calcium-binding EGF-like domain-containing protein [Thermoanaerobaculia bacterium]